MSRGPKLKEAVRPSNGRQERQSVAVDFDIAINVDVDVMQQTNRKSLFIESTESTKPLFTVQKSWSNSCPEALQMKPCISLTARVPQSIIDKFKLVVSYQQIIVQIVLDDNVQRLQKQVIHHPKNHQ